MFRGFHLGRRGWLKCGRKSPQMRSMLILIMELMKLLSQKYWTIMGQCLSCYECNGTNCRCNKFLTERQDIMKKLVIFWIVISIMLSMTLCVFAKDPEEISTDATAVRVVDVGEGHQIVHYGDAVIDDSVTQEYRKIVTQCDGGVSEYYEDFSTGVATIKVNGSIVDIYNMRELRDSITTWEMPEEDAARIHEFLAENRGKVPKELPAELKDNYELSYDQFGTPVIKPTLDVASTRAVNIVYPDGSVTSAYPEYMYKQVSTRTVYSAVCGRNLNMAIKDCMYSYSLKSRQNRYFAAETAISVIAGTFKIAIATVLQTLLGYVKTVAGVVMLSRGVDYYFSESYSFEAMRQTYVYDYTENNAYVSVQTEYGSGQLAMTWDFRNNEYTNPAWKITALAYPHTISFDQMYSEGQEIWEYNMTEFGYWKWGNI